MLANGSGLRKKPPKSFGFQVLKWFRGSGFPWYKVRVKGQEKGWIYGQYIAKNRT